MKTFTARAKTEEIAQYADGISVHCALARGENGGIDENGQNDFAIYEERKALGEWPKDVNGLDVHAVVSHERDGILIKSHWKNNRGEVDRFMAKETYYHTSANIAVLEMIHEGRILDLLSRKDDLDGFEFGACHLEYLISANGNSYKADVAAIDKQFPDLPIVFEVVYSSDLKRQKIEDLNGIGLLIFKANIKSMTIKAVEEMERVDVAFYKRRLASKFKIASVKAKISGRWRDIAEAKDRERLARARAEAERRRLAVEARLQAEKKEQAERAAIWERERAEREEQEKIAAWDWAEKQAERDKYWEEKREQAKREAAERAAVKAAEQARLKAEYEAMMADQPYDGDHDCFYCKRAGTSKRAEKVVCLGPARYVFRCAEHAGVGKTALHFA